MKGFLSAAATAIIIAGVFSSSSGLANAQYPTSGSISGSGSGSGSSSSCTLNAPITLDAALTLQQGINSQDGTVTIRLEYAGTGWIGLGFAQAMVPSTAVIGLPETQSVGTYAMTDRSNAGVTQLTSAAALTNAAITQTGTTTVLEFTKPLSESGQTAVSSGPNTIIWAYGKDNAFPNYHKARGVAASVEFSECLSAGTTLAPATQAPVTPTSAPVAAGGAGGRVDLGNGRIQFAFNGLENGQLDMLLTTDSNANTLTVDMTVQRQSYVAFAFSRDLQMPDSVAVIARPDLNEGGVPRKWDMGGARTASAITLAPDSRQTLINATYTQTSGQTRMTFTKLLTENDPAEIDVSLSQPNFFLYAVGPAGNAFAYHDLRAGFQFNFATDGGNISVGGGPPNRALWIAHGILMVAAWVALVPLAVAASVLRHLLPHGMWFQIHRFLNTLGIAATFAGFGIAVHLINKEQGATAVHFKTLRHHKIGLVIFIFAFLQGLSGVFRPHLPHPKNSQGNDGDEDEEANEELAEPKTAEAEPEPLKKSPQRVAFEYGHRLVGTTAIILGWYNCSSGIDAFNNRFKGPDLNPALWGVVAGIAFTTLALAAYQRFRPTQ